MKPIMLTIDGINSFYDKQVIDFRFDGLFCISGDTGSGKTTILDCIIIALYGSSKRTSSISDYINLRRDRAEIKLVFETSVDGNRYEFEVVRNLGKTANKARLSNLTTGETIAEQTEKVNAAIMQMLALSRDDFTQVVILEQGKFAKFLSAGKKERNNTVGNLFKLNKYKDLGSKTMQLLSRTKDKLEQMSGRLNELALVTQSAINDKQKCIMGAENRISELKNSEKSLLDSIAKLEQKKRIYDDCVLAEVELKNKYDESVAMRSKLNEALAKVSELNEELNFTLTKKNENSLILARSGELKRLIDEAKKRENSVDKLRDDWRKADVMEKELNEKLIKLIKTQESLNKQLNEAKDELFSIADLGENDGYCDISDIKTKVFRFDYDLKSSKNELAAATEKANTCCERRQAALNRHSLAMQAEAVAKERAEALRAEVNELERTFEGERRLEAAHYVRSGLKEGDVCPVCGGIVRGEASEVHFSDTERRLNDLRKMLAKAEEELYEVQKSVYSFGTALDECSKALDEAERQKKVAEQKTKELMKSVKLHDKIGKLNSIASTVYDKNVELNECKNEIKLYTQRRDDAHERANEIRQRGECERKEMDRLKGEIQSSGMSESEIEIASAREIELKKRIEELEVQANEWERKKSVLSDAYASLKATIDILEQKIKGKPNFDQTELEAAKVLLEKNRAEYESLIAMSAKDAAELDALKANYEVKKDLEEQKKALKNSYDIYSDIYKLVSGDKFIEYVAEEYILQFTESASTVLSDITGGKYTLSYHDGDFYVKDFLFGGMERKANTLSGGETFLASLSLAIAISREIARYKTYEFFFLDEGFGTLDEHSLETVADALTLLADDTLVGVVTHRKELTDRIFDKITVVAPCGEGGSTVIRS